MAYKGIMGSDTAVSMPMGITCVACLVRLVAMGCSAVGIGRPSAGIGRVISGEIERSLKQKPGEQIPAAKSRWRRMDRRAERKRLRTSRVSLVLVLVNFASLAIQAIHPFPETRHRSGHRCWSECCAASAEDLSAPTIAGSPSPLVLELQWVNDLHSLIICEKYAVLVCDFTRAQPRAPTASFTKLLPIIFARVRWGL